MAILVTGGAGYIGSHTAAALLERGEEVVVLDNLQTGHRRAAEGCLFYEGDIRDGEAMDRIFGAHEIDAVIHFAANSLVAESMSDPGRYYHNNVCGTLCLLERMRAHGVKRIVFSSTAAVYGEPERVPIRETDRTEPTNAYGETKLAMERMIRWFGVAHGIESVSLRYFNAAGAHESGRIGEDHDPETHLVPIVLQAALGKRPHVAIFGDDYPTPDGTCIRDYIHVSDLADAHLLAVDRLRRGEGSAVYNLGSGRGWSVREIIEQARRETGRDIPVVVQPRRAGDPAVLVASPERAKRELGWNPRRSDIGTIIRTAWAWHAAHPDGYGDR